MNIKMQKEFSKRTIKQFNINKFIYKAIVENASTIIKDKRDKALVRLINNNISFTLLDKTKRII